MEMTPKPFPCLCISFPNQIFVGPKNVAVDYVDYVDYVVDIAKLNVLKLSKLKNGVCAKCGR